MKRVVFTIVFALLLVLMLATSATASEQPQFLGWSPDGTFYALNVEDNSGGKSPVLCLSDPRAGSTTWPAGVPRPPSEDWAFPGRDEACVYVCKGRYKDSYGSSPTGDCGDEKEWAAALKRMRTWVRLPTPSKVGPHGETVTAKKGKQKLRIGVMAGGKQVADRALELDRRSEFAVREIYWRPDGGAVAVHVGPSAKETEGDIPSEYVEVIAVTASKPAPAPGAPGDRAAAAAANARGMARYREKDYAGAATEFRAALAADAGSTVAHYNLACVAALLSDKKTALEQLRWLASSPDPAAAAKLKKAATDPDLRSLADDPEARRILGPAPAAATASPGRSASQVPLVAGEELCTGLCDDANELQENPLTWDAGGGEKVVLVALTVYHEDGNDQGMLIAVRGGERQDLARYRYNSAWSGFARLRRKPDGGVVFAGGDLGHSETPGHADAWRLEWDALHRKVKIARHWHGDSDSLPAWARK